MYIVPLSGLESLEPIRAKGEAPVQTENHAAVPFSDMLKEAVQNLEEVQATTQQDAYDLATGSVTDLHKITINAAMQQTAIEMTVQIASRAVSAYKEVLQMQI